MKNGQATWKRFFHLEAKQYDQECFVQDTEREIAFLLEEFRLPEGSAILDVGCGTGRHSLELAQRGYVMAGVDLSADMLDEARRKAAGRGLDIEFVERDAAELDYEDHFDAAICLCEGCLCLLGNTDDPHDRDIRVLSNIRRALKPGGRFLCTVLNAVRSFRQNPVSESFDLFTQVEMLTHTLQTDSGPETLVMRERQYTPSEFRLMVRLAGFEVEHIWGSTAGNWRRGPLDPDEMEFMVVARRPQ